MSAKPTERQIRAALVAKATQAHRYTKVEMDAARLVAYNAAIEAAAKACENPDITGSASAGKIWRMTFAREVRALKREPR